MLRCPNCQQENQPEARFCMRCGTVLARACPVCGATNPPEAHFCLRCGAPFASVTGTERRVLTVLFADLVGSTSLTTGMDPERVRALVGDYFAAMRVEIERHGGVVEKFIGDAVMAVFGLPTAHEDDPERAVRTAVAMQARMGDLNARLGADLHIRIGIGTGEAVADPGAVIPGEFIVTGEVVNLAARLQQQAPTDGIVIDERTHQATERMVRSRLLPPPDAGDFAGRPRWQVLGLAEEPRPKGLRAPMVGREDEMQFLHALYRRAVDGRRHHLVTVTGASGLGKTRLAEEFIARLEGSPDPPVVLQGRCPAYGEGLTYWPLAEMLKQYGGIKDNDPAAVIAEKLRVGVLRVVEPVAGREEAELIVADLASILGLKVGLRPAGLVRALARAVSDERPQAEVRAGELRPRGDIILRALRAFFASLAATRPLVLVFEDLHWAEESLLELLEHMAVRGLEGPVLTLCLARPELLERHAQWGGRVRNYVAVSLTPLEEGQDQRLLSELLAGEGLPADVREAVLAKAEGNPLFIEEILRMLIDSGRLVREPSGWRWAAGPLEIRMPDTLQGILVSRLDLLSPLEKRVIQVASVGGRIFWLGALVATGDLNAPEAAVALERLQERELIEERSTSSVAGEREFAFRHALIREAALSTVPKAARSTYYLRFAEWLEKTAAANLDEFLEVLAHHYEWAWRYSPETDERNRALARRAIDMLRRAAERALALRTLPEARRLYDRALKILRHAGLEEDLSLRLELLTGRAEATKWISSPRAVIEDTEIVLQHAAAAGREDLLARAYLNRAFAEYDGNRLQPAEDALGRALELFRRLNDRQGEAEALEMLGAIIDSLRGRPSKAQKAYRQALDLYREMGAWQGTARTMTWLGMALLGGGQLDQARDALQEGLRLARIHHERISEGAAHLGLGILAHLTGDSSDAVEHYRRAIAIRHDLGDLMLEAATRRHLGMHYLRHGRPDEAEGEIEAARALRREHGVENESASLVRALAEIALARGDIFGAAEYAEQALAAVPEDDLIARATHRATLARIRAAQGHAEEAQRLFEQSIEALEASEYRIDLALTLLKYGEALAELGNIAAGRHVLDRARRTFAEIGATNFSQLIEARLATAGV